MNFASRLTRQCANLLSPFESVQYTTVRYRYWADKVAKGRLLKGFGYKETIFTGGLLPRLENKRKLPLPDYRPKNKWFQKRALFGQNDYIDILGNGRLDPVTVSYEVPKWLRGVEGNEMQLLIRKAKVFSRGPYRDEHPTAWNNIQKRIRYLYTHLNRHTKTGLMRK